MTTNDEILTIANRLANSGQKPSVALIKKQLSHPVPLPKIITILKSWQHDPNFTHYQESEVTLPPLNHQHEQISEIVEQAIQPLKEEITELKALVKLLINNKFK